MTEIIFFRIIVEKESIIIFVLDENKKELELMKDKFKEIMKIYDSKENNEFYYIKVISIIYYFIISQKKRNYLQL